MPTISTTSHHGIGGITPQMKYCPHCGGHLGPITTPKENVRPEFTDTAEVQEKYDENEEWRSENPSTVQHSQTNFHNYNSNIEIRNRRTREGWNFNTTSGSQLLRTSPSSHEYEQRRPRSPSRSGSPRRYIASPTRRENGESIPESLESANEGGTTGRSGEVRVHTIPQVKIEVPTITTRSEILGTHGSVGRSGSGRREGSPTFNAAPTRHQHQRIDITPTLPPYLTNITSEYVRTQNENGENGIDATIGGLNSIRGREEQNGVRSVTFHNDTISGQGSAPEEECRRILQRIYNSPFPRRRPSWLINNLTGRRMELDGYSEKHRIAFEYNGEQHYRSDHPFNRSHQAFLDQVYRDNLKVELCDARGVYLITVPYNVPFRMLESYIRHYLPEEVMARRKHNINSELSLNFENGIDGRPLSPRSPRD